MAAITAKTTAIFVPMERFLQNMLAGDPRLLIRRGDHIRVSGDPRHLTGRRNNANEREAHSQARPLPQLPPSFILLVLYRAMSFGMCPGYKIG
ncbi:hypothetical protein D3C79_810010 [compost metagenome]